MLTSGQTTALLTYCRPMAIQMRKDKRTPTSHCKTSKTKQAKKKQKCMPHPNDCLKSCKLGHWPLSSFGSTMRQNNFRKNDIFFGGYGWISNNFADNSAQKIYGFGFLLLLLLLFWMKLPIFTLQSFDSKS